MIEELRKKIDEIDDKIAALYLDGGFEAARAFLQPFITEGSTADEDYKTQLQEVAQETPGAQLSYTVIKEEGPAHDKQFAVEVRLNGKPLATGTGRSKKAAEQQAARTALEKMGREA